MTTLTPEEIQRRVDALAEYGSLSAAARAIGVAKSSIHRASQTGIRPTPVERIDWDTDELPDELETGEQIWGRAEQRFERLLIAKEARRWIDIRINIDGPFGVAHMGDQHIENPGTHLKLLRQHAEVIRKTEGLFAGEVGDTLDAWPTNSKLTKLKGKSPVTDKEALRLAEYFFSELLARKLIYSVGGNHDAHLPADVKQQMAAVSGSVFQEHGVNLRLKQGGCEFLVLARHDWPGNSQWNAAHGPGKHAQLGFRGDVLVCGHKHTAGYQVVQDPMTRKITHCLRIASYKIFDEFQEEHFPINADFMVAPVTIFDPDARDERYRTTTFFEPVAAADYLTWLRKNWREGKRT